MADLEEGGEQDGEGGGRHLGEPPQGEQEAARGAVEQLLDRWGVRGDR